jgi:hypothetical protein
MHQGLRTLGIRALLASAACTMVVLAPAQADGPAAAASASAESSGTAHAPAEEKWAFLDKYCSECHNAEDWAGGVAFDTLSPESIPEEPETFEHAVRKLRGRLMPPPGKPQPDKAELTAFVSWLENTLDEAAAKHPDPGRIPLHRLNRKEYANAVYDLVGLKLDVKEMLPPDDQVDGFDNVANVLQVSPSFMEQYISAARIVATQAIGDMTPRTMGVTYNARSFGTTSSGSQGCWSQQCFHVEGLPLGTRGGMMVEHVFPADGEYILNISNMAVALWVYNLEFEHTLIATLDGEKFFETKIGGEEDMKAIDQKQDVAVDAINARLKNIKFHATAGPHKVAVTFVHRSFAESEDRLASLQPGGGNDRVLRVNSIEIRGPFKTYGISDTPYRQRVFTCHPDKGAEEKACARQIVTQLATKAFRRPVSDAEVQSLLKFYESGRAEGDFDSGIRRALTVILASPYFLYRAEPAPQMLKAGDTYSISDLEFATRLAFFLWASLPDEELLKVASEGRIRDPQVLEAQVRRLLKDPRSETLASNFAFQWLNVAKLDEINPDPNVFPYAGDPREDFRTELRLFIDSVFREDRSVLDLLTADHTYLNERLANHYGINTVKGDRFRRVTLPDSRRYGLLGKGAVLMLTSYPNRTAPVLRGAWILERIMGTPPAAPPPDVEALKEAEPGKKAKTIRELMARHSETPACYSCHGVMDPLGFALENFDAVGQWRDIDRFARTKIDSSGVLPDGSHVSGPDDLRKALLANPEQFVQTMTEKLMTYATGRTIEAHDMPAIRAIVREAAGDNYRFSSLVLNIVRSAPFQMRKLPKNDTLTTQLAEAHVQKK